MTNLYISIIGLAWIQCNEHVPYSHLKCSVLMVRLQLMYRLHSPPHCLNFNTIAFCSRVVPYKLVCPSQYRSALQSTTSSYPATPPLSRPLLAIPSPLLRVHWPRPLQGDQTGRGEEKKYDFFLFQLFFLILVSLFIDLY